MTPARVKTGHKLTDQVLVHPTLLLPIFDRLHRLLNSRIVIWYCLW
jgi:hypothetical protein